MVWLPLVLVFVVVSVVGVASVVVVGGVGGFGGVVGCGVVGVCDGGAVVHVIVGCDAAVRVCGVVVVAGIGICCWCGCW